MELLKLDSDIILHDGTLIFTPEAGTPSVEIPFSHSFNRENGELIVTLSEVPVDVTHWRVHLVLRKSVVVVNSVRTPISATTDPVNLGSIHSLFNVTIDVEDYETIYISLIPINENGDGPPGRSYRLVPEINAPVDIEVTTDATLEATKVGDSFVRQVPETNIEAISVIRVLQISDNEIDWTDYGSDPSTVPADAATKYLRDYYTITGPSENVVFSASNSIGPVGELVVDEELFQILAEDVSISSSFYDCGSSEWFRPTIQLSERLIGRRIRATTTRPDLYPNDGPEIHWSGEVVPHPTLGPEYYTINQIDPSGQHCVFPLPGTAPNADFWLFSEEKVANRQRIRLSQQPLSSDPENDPWSPMSADHPTAWFVPVPGDDLPDSSVLEYRGVLLRSPEQLGMTPNVPQLDPYGFYPIDGFQWYPGCGSWSADGLKIITSQDAAQLQMSEDQGQTCYRPRANGLPLLVGAGVAFHPTENDTIFVSSGPGFQYQAKYGLRGVYRSTDNAQNFTRVYTTPQSPGRGQNVTTSFAFNGSTIWYCSGQVNSTNQPTDGVLARSTNNGDSFTTIANLPFSTYGRIYAIAVSQQNASHIWIACEGGLFRSTNAGSTINKTWSTGIPTNRQITSVWVDPDDSDHILAGVLTGTNQGLWESTNGTDFTRIRDCRLIHFGVGAKDANDNRTIYIQQTFASTSDANETPHVRLRDGTWITRTSSPTALKINFMGVWDNIMPGNGVTFDNSVMKHGWMAPHPTDPDLCLYHAKTSFFVTEDGGHTFTMAMGGLGGVNWRGAMFDPFDRTRVVGSTHDMGAVRSKDGLSTIEPIRFGPFTSRAKIAITGSSNGISSFTGRDCLILPNSTELPPGWRGRLIGGAGSSSSGNGVLWYLNWNESVIRDWLGSNPQQGQSNSQGGGVGVRTTAGFILEDPRKAWVGVNRITITSENSLWTTVGGGRIIFGAANDGTDRVYGFRSANTTLVDVSDDFGATWSNFADFGGTIISAGLTDGHVSMFDGRRMFVSPSNRVLAMAWDNNGTAEITSWDLTSTIFSGLSPLPADAIIEGIKSDPLDPRWIYIGTKLIGNGRKVWRGKFNSSFTTITWEDVTLNGPSNAHGMHIHVNGHSGDVQVSHNGMGQYMLPAPEDWQPRCGAFRFSGQPSNGQTITINGQTITFVTSGATGLQVNIGGNLSTTMTNLANVLNSSGNATISKYSYTAVTGNRLDVFIKDPRVNIEEDVPLTAGTTSNAKVVFAVKPFKRYYWSRMPIIGNI